ncbi:MAG: hypothetical protein ACM3SO_17235, partial [Betaproteobacteria bacterium]
MVGLDVPAGCYKHATTNAHGLYARRSDGDVAESVFFRCIFHWYRNARLIDLMAVGGSGGHFAPEYFDALLIPKFPDAVKTAIVRLYDAEPAAAGNPKGASYLVARHDLRNNTFGLWQLDRDMR